MSSKAETKSDAGPGKPAEGKVDPGIPAFVRRAREIADALAEEGEAAMEVQKRYDELWNDPKRNMRSARRAVEG